LADGVEGLDRGALGVGVGLEHQRRDRADEHGLGHPAGAVAAHIPGDLAPAGGVADQDHLVQVEGVDELGQVVGVGVQVMAGPGLGRAAMGAAVMSDGPVAV
jgi:hypothetical protein